MIDPKFHLVKYLNIIQFESNGKEVSFECSHCRISSTDSKGNTTLNVSIADSGSEKVKCGHALIKMKATEQYSLGAAYYLA